MYMIVTVTMGFTTTKNTRFSSLCKGLHLTLRPFLGNIESIWTMVC